jgi:hypothetical protein
MSCRAKCKRRYKPWHAKTPANPFAAEAASDQASAPAYRPDLAFVVAIDVAA